MQGLKRKLVFLTLYEAIAIACSTAALMLVSDHGPAHSGMLAVVASAIAVSWNFIYNSLFEAWEARQPKRGRGVARRLAHAGGYELGLLLICIPLFAWWLDISLWQAFMLDIGFLVFFLCYTFCFNWAFDSVFGLPKSAQG